MYSSEAQIQFSPQINRQKTLTPIKVKKKETFCTPHGFRALLVYFTFCFNSIYSE